MSELGQILVDHFRCVMAVAIVAEAVTLLSNIMHEKDTHNTIES